MMKVYFISGLGADSNVFTHIRLPENCTPVYLHWKEPFKSETLKQYALRLSEKIDRDENFILVGLSMGGMIATEISKELSPAATILISSVPVSKQLPVRFKIAYALKLHKLVPVAVIKSATIMKRIFTVESPGDKIILRQVIRESDPLFVRWALHAILQWDNDVIPPNLFHIHGTKDEILPFRYVKPTHAVQGGKHMMVMSKASELNVILDGLLNSIMKNSPGI